MSLFGKKQTVQALAEVLEDGRAKMNELMQKPKYRNYEGEGDRLTAGGTNVRHEDYETFHTVVFGGLINF